MPAGSLLDLGRSGSLLSLLSSWRCYGIGAYHPFPYAQWQLLVLSTLPRNAQLCRERLDKAAHIWADTRSHVSQEANVRARLSSLRRGTFSGTFPGQAPLTKMSSHFQLLQQFKPDYSPSEFTEYESQRTGMRVVVIDQKGPKVNGYFVLATEIHDDSGAPHTLEHLCFMGSRNYRYKGFLDKLATRVYSSTNAWTATDHTAYTLDTAGWEGFARILPVYLEHVIAPTLTDEGCYTEVHHIDGTGNDAGVVYSEMQGVQNNAAELIDLAARRLTYPEGVGFRYETGGMMEQLRVLTAERIRQFHREMYQPKNLCLVITGEVDQTNMLNILDKFEDTILDVIPSPDAPFKRPWVDSKQTPPLEKSVVQKIEFPEEDESFGEIEIRFQGPDCNDPVQCMFLSLWMSTDLVLMPR